MSAQTDNSERSCPEAMPDSDFTGGAVPLPARRGGLTMGLLWITMVTGFPSVLIGFEWYRQGLSLPQVLFGIAVSCFLLLLYCLPACYLGAASGLTYALLSRKVFGIWGSRLVSANLVWVSIGWYGLTAVFLADGLKGLFHWTISTPLLSVVLAILMAFNNFFGFSGVANFARYLAGPVLVLWVGYAFCKAVPECQPQVWTQAAHLSNPAALTIVSLFCLGYAVWGNEADYWRFGKPRIKSQLIPLVVSWLIGQVLFPVTGWILARNTGITDYDGATRLMNNYAFGGITVVAAFVLIVTYVAVNDSSLYGAINALQNLVTTRRKKVAALLALTGAATAYMLSFCSNNFEAVASLSCIVLPSATVVLMAELLIVRHFIGDSTPLSLVPPPEKQLRIKWSAVIALLSGCFVGTLTSGLIPGTQALHGGVPALQAWLTTIIVYLSIRCANHVLRTGESRSLEVTQSPDPALEASVLHVVPMEPPQGK